MNTGLSSRWQLEMAKRVVSLSSEGDGPDRRRAITGAGRRPHRGKQAEQLQRLLLNRLNHRVKNTLATIRQHCTDPAGRTRSASARGFEPSYLFQAQVTTFDFARLDRREFVDIVMRALRHLLRPSGGVGSAIEVSPKHAFAARRCMSLPLTPPTRRRHAPRVRGRRRNVAPDWEESVGPRCATNPKGRQWLLEGSLFDLGGDTKLNYMLIRRAM
jgi:hypothetical protein